MLDVETVGASSPDHRWLAATLPVFVSAQIAQRSDIGERQARIANLVARQVVPRLAAAHPAKEQHELFSGCSESDVRALVELVLGPDTSAAYDHVGALKARGVTADALYLDLLQPAARHLGEMWERDACDIVDVTLGVGRLQALLAAVGDLRQTVRLRDRRTVYLTVTPGDQHFFGVSMVERFFRGGGWDVLVEEEATIENLCATVSGGWYAVAGLSSGSETHLDVLADAIAAIRRSSLNRTIAVMVGGPVFIANPELAATVGADATASNGPTAVVAAQRLFEAANYAA